MRNGEHRSGYGRLNRSPRTTVEVRTDAHQRKDERAWPRSLRAETASRRTHWWQPRWTARPDTTVRELNVMLEGDATY